MINAVELAYKLAQQAKASGRNYEICVVDSIETPFKRPQASRRHVSRSKYKPRIDTPKHERNKPSGAEVIS